MFYEKIEPIVNSYTFVYGPELLWRLQPYNLLRK